MNHPTLQDRLDVRMRPNRPPVMYQRWSNLLFAHWEIDPEIIQNRLPEGLFVDTLNDQTFIGLVPFYMQKVRPRFFPALPWLSNFMELNVRCYVYDHRGRPGVWFFSLDCNQPIAVEIARKLFHLPYEHSVMRTKRELYTCRRKGQHELAKYDFSDHGHTQQAQVDSLEFFLLERYLLFSQSSTGKIRVGQVHHQPYQFSKLPIQQIDTTPLSWNHFEIEGNPSSLLNAPGLDVEIFALTDS